MAYLQQQKLIIILTYELRGIFFAGHTACVCSCTEGQRRDYINA